MSSEPQSPATMRPASRDTGFPEPFCGHRNTTLPHPEANLSPDASITADDIDFGRALRRTRRTFLSRHKRIISHGFITPQMEAKYNSTLTSLADSDGDEAVSTTTSGPTAVAAAAAAGTGPAKRVGTLGSAASSSENRESLDQAYSESTKGEQSPTSTTQKRMTVLRKLFKH